jgi:hypothetical protein
VLFVSPSVGNAFGETCREPSPISISSPAAGMREPNAPLATVPYSYQTTVSRLLGFTRLWNVAEVVP